MIRSLSVSSALPAPLSMSLLRRLFHSAPDGICVLDADGCFTLINAAAEGLWGYPSEALTGRSQLAFVHPDDFAVAEAALSGAIRNPESIPFSIRFRCVGSRYSTFSWSVTWDREAQLFFCTVRPADENVTLLREHLQAAAEELGRCQERFRLVARTDAVYDWDLVQDTLHWGEGLYHIFGYQPHELQMPQWEAALHPEEGVELMAFLQQTLNDAASGSWTAEYRLRRPDGSWANVEEKASILRDEAGRPVRMVGRLEDITKRKEHERELRKLSQITQQTEDAIVVTDAEKRTTWVNDAFTRLTGFTLSDMLGRRPAIVLEGPQPDAALLDRVDAGYREKRPFNVEALNYRKDGTPFWSIISIQPVLDAEGNVLEYFSIRKDITDRKRLEQELEQQRQQMTAAVIAAQEKERSDMSQELHDNVNQVLTTVKLYQELLLSGIGNRDELAQKSMRLLQESINEIRSISKRLSAPSLGKIRLHESVRELADAVAATNRVRVTLDSTAITGYDCPQEAHIALYRILQEQLTNVLKHAAATQVHIGFGLSESRLIMEVCDNGIGFDPDAGSPGTGLNNMQSRAQGLGGSVRVHTAPGAGCSIRVELPT